MEQDKSDKDAQLTVLLNDLGRKLVTTKDGLGLAVSDDAKDFKAEDINVADIVASLTQKELEMVGPDEEKNNPQAAAKIIASKVAEAFASQIPPITAKAEDMILTQRERDDAWYDFTSEKLADGKTPRFPDCDKPDVIEDIKRALNAGDDRMVALHEAGMKDANLHKALVELAFLRANRARQTVMTLKAADQKLQADKKDDNKNKPSVDGVNGSGTKTPESASETDRITSIMDEAVKSGLGLHS